MKPDPQRLIILTGAYDDHHLRTRSDKPALCTSSGKRLMLYRAISEAAGQAPLLLSPQPRGTTNCISLPAVESQFGEFQQLFAPASGTRKVRYLVDIIRYIEHVHRNSRNGDTLIFDNYELIYILAIYYCRLRGRSNRILLEYEDGKHVIDRGYPKLISGLAEKIGRRLVQAAILATPSLGERLPPEIPKVLIPGILRTDWRFKPAPASGQPVSFLYSGSLDVERGVPLLLDYLASNCVSADTVYHITGRGHYRELFLNLMELHPGKIHFHGSVSEEALAQIRSSCHFGLNLQSSTSPISQVTYPSKTFDYLNAGIRVISTKAAGVEDILGSAAIYLNFETVEGLADAVARACESIRSEQAMDMGKALNDYSFQGTVLRLKSILERAPVSTTVARILCSE